MAMAENCLPFPETLGIPEQGPVQGWPLAAFHLAKYHCGSVGLCQALGMQALHSGHGLTGAHWKHAFFGGEGVALLQGCPGLYGPLLEYSNPYYVGSFMKESNKTFQLGFIHIPLPLSQENPLHQCYCSQVPPKKN